MIKRFEGALGILMLDSHANHLPGDPARDDTFTAQVVRSIARGVDHQALQERNSGTLAALTAGLNELVALGAEYIVGTSGLLSLYHNELQSVTPVPFADSALSLLPVLRDMYDVHRVGIVTADSRLLTTDHLAAYGVSFDDLPVFGLQDCPHFMSLMNGERGCSALSDILAETTDTLQSGLAAHPGIQLFISECTNAIPLHKAWRESLELPVLDVFSLLELMYTAFRN